VTWCDFFNLKLAMWCTPKLLNRFNYKSKGENVERKRNWGTFLNLQHYEGRRACWSSRMGTITCDKHVNYSHKLAQTEQQVSSCVVGTFLVHRRITNIHIEALPTPYKTQKWVQVKDSGRGSRGMLRSSQHFEG